MEELKEFIGIEEFKKLSLDEICGFLSFYSKYPVTDLSITMQGKKKCISSKIWPDIYADRPFLEELDYMYHHLKRGDDYTSDSWYLAQDPDCAKVESEGIEGWLLVVVIEGNYIPPGKLTAEHINQITGSDDGVPKNHYRLKSIGSVDEYNENLGLDVLSLFDYYENKQSQL